MKGVKGGFLTGLIAAAGIFAALCFAGTLKIKPCSAAPLNPAEKRKQKAAGRNQRRWCLTTAALCIVAVLSSTVLKTISKRAVELSPAEAMIVIGAEIVIPVTQVEDGHLHRFALAALDDRLSALADMPYMYPVYDKNPAYRKMVVSDYLVFYKVNDAERTIVVHRILHGSHDLERHFS